MKRVLLLATLLLALFATPAYAVNDPLVPGDECSASGTAVGHPAFTNEQADPVSAPFSKNNPGESPGAQGSANAGPGCPAPNK